MGILKVKSEVEHAPDKESHEYLNSKFDVKYIPKSLKTKDDGFTWKNFV